MMNWLELKKTVIKSFHTKKREETNYMQGEARAIAINTYFKQ